MAIPVFRHNFDHDDWEVASVYDSDECGSLGGSAYDQSLHSSGSLLDPVSHLEGYPYDDIRPRFVNGYPVPQQQYPNYPPAPSSHPRWDARYVPGRPNSFVIPPPGVIFPPKDWVHPPQESYWPSTGNPMATSSDRSAGVGLVESPPLPPLLLSPSSPPPSAAPLIKRPLPATTTGHGQTPHGTSVTVTGTYTVPNVNAHASPIMPPPPRYHEVAHAIPPRLADAGCQAHSNMAMSPPRRSGHDVLTYGGPGHGTVLRGPWTSEPGEFAVGYGGLGGPGGHPGYAPEDRPDGHPPLVPSKYEHEHEHERDGGQTRTGRPQIRERRPSIWQRFVRRFGPSHVSVGQT